VGPERAGLYMGIHATLTGLRGAFAPFLGTALYVGWDARALPAGVTLPAYEGLGAPLFLLSAALSTTATLGFVALHRRLTHAAP
ncbi:MAG: hypothetical protein R3263_04180, partial [Myxococcota bacterium]|nr:hypothetical protein [Myxococcota bacterium]